MGIEMGMSKFRMTLFSVLVMISVVVHGEIHKWMDENGKVH